jgi:Caudovirus prohead serine protease
MKMPRALAEIKAEQAQLRTRVGQMVDQARELEIKLSIDGADGGLEERKANIERGKAKASARLEELGAEHREAITRMVESGQTHVEAGVNLEHGSTRTDDAPAIEPHRKSALDGALRTLERCQRGDVMDNRAAVAMERVVRHSDPTGSTARYLTAVGDPAYFRAFGKLLQYGTTASMRMTADEAEDGRGVRYEVPLFDTQYNRELAPGLKAGAYGSSFRFNVTAEDYNKRAKASEYNPDGLPERTVKEVRMQEFGPVTFPAYEGASAGMRSLTDRFYSFLPGVQAVTAERTEEFLALIGG